MNNNLRRTFPPIVSGYELLEKDGFFSFIVPTTVETTNNISNPSFEDNLTWYVAGGGLTISQSSVKQYRGFFGMKCVSTASGSSVYYPVTGIIGTDSTFSLDIFIPVNGSVLIAIYDSGAIVSQKRIDGNGYWKRVYITHKATSTSVRCYINFTSALTIYTDGWQYEYNPYPTSYIDGDQSGFVINEQAYYWTGLRHASKSIRSSSTRTGGREYKLSDFGFRTFAFSGIGAVSVENIASPLFQGGSFYQRTLKRERTVTISGAITGKTISEIENNRKKFERYIVDYELGSQQPMMLIYNRTKEDGSVFERLLIPCFYSSGLTGNINNVNQEQITLEFTQFLPSIWRENILAVSDLSLHKCFQSTGSGQTLYKDVNDYWSSPYHTTAKTFYDRFTGDIYFYGFVGLFDGISDTNGIAKLSNGVISALSVGVNGGTNIINSIDVNYDGFLVAVGGFTSASATPNTSKVAMYKSGTWYSVGTGGITGYLAEPYGVTYSKDGKSFVIAGSFDTVEGVAAEKIAFYSIPASTWYPIGTGIAGGITSPPNGVLRDDNGNIYVYGNIATCNGVTTGAVAKLVVGGSGWNSFVALEGERLTAVTSGSNVYSLFYNSDKYLYVGGTDLANPPDTIPLNFARWNGSSWKQMPGADQTTSTQIWKFSDYIIGEILFTYTVPLIGTTKKVVGTNFENFDYYDGSGSGFFPGYLGGRKDGYLGLAYVKYAMIAGQDIINNPNELTNVVTFHIKGPIQLYDILNPITKSSIRFSPLVLSSKEYAILSFNGSSMSIKSNTGQDLSRYVMNKSLNFSIGPGSNFIKIRADYFSSYYRNSSIYTKGTITIADVYKLAGVKRSNSDNGRLYFSITFSTPWYRLMIYSDSARTVQVAQSDQFNSITGFDIAITQLNSSGITGAWTTAATVAGADAGYSDYGLVSIIINPTDTGIVR